MGNMPPHAMGGMTADHMGNMPPEAMAGMDGTNDASLYVPPDAMGGMGPMHMEMYAQTLWAVWDQCIWK